MNLLKSIWRIIISVFGFLIVWIFLPMFSIIGIFLCLVSLGYIIRLEADKAQNTEE